MTELPRYPDTDDDPGAEPDREPTTSTPWGPYVFGAIAIVVVLVIIALHLTGVLGPGSHR